MFDTFSPTEMHRINKALFLHTSFASYECGCPSKYLTSTFDSVENKIDEITVGK